MSFNHWMNGRAWHIILLLQIQEDHKKNMKLPIAIVSGVAAAVAAASDKGSTSSSCRFAQKYTCSDFADRTVRESYMDHIIEWESHFAVPGIGYDAASGYTYDGHPIEYSTGNLYGEPHMFSAPSKGESTEAICTFRLIMYLSIAQSLSMLASSLSPWAAMSARWPFAEAIRRRSACCA